MARATKIFIVSLASIIGIVMLVVAIVFIGGNTGPGRRVIVALVPRLSGGAVMVHGLSGRFPDRLRIAEMEIRDAAGTFATLKRVSLDWSPSRLLFGEIVIDKLDVAHAQLARLPAERPVAGASPSWPRIRVHHLAIARLDLAAPVAGIPAALELEGHLELASLTQGTAALKARRLDATGRYDLDLQFTPASVDAEIAISEPGRGLVGGLTGLPDLGPLTVRAKLAGPQGAAQTDIVITAGPLHGTAKGTVDLWTSNLDLDLRGAAPAMAPRPGLTWQAATLDAHIRGPVARPDIAAHLAIDDLTAADGRAQKVTAEVTGTAGALRLEAVLSGLRVPGRKPDLFESAPMTVTATTDLRDTNRPVVFAVSHPLMTASGKVDTAGKVQGRIALRLASLAPVAAVTGVDIEGHAVLDATFVAEGSGFRIGTHGKVSVAGGQAQAVRLLGPDTTFDLGGLVQGSTIKIDRATLESRALHASVQGTRQGGILDLTYRLAMSDLSRLAPTLTGALDASGKISGPENDFTLTAEARGMLGADKVAKGPIAVSLQARGLPNAPSARLAANGTIAGAPLHVQAAAERTHDGALQLTIQRAEWKSATAKGGIVLSRNRAAPSGRLELRIASLGDLAPFVGAALNGKLSATISGGMPQGKPEIQIQAAAEQVTVGTTKIARLTLDGRIGDPLARPLLKLQIGIAGIKVNDLTGRATMAADGLLDALALRLNGEMTSPHGPATLMTEATLHLSQRRLDVSALRAVYGRATARLLAPTTIDFRSGVALAPLRLSLDKALITAGGRLSPALDFRLSARDLDPALARFYLPALQIDGSFSVEARLAGTLAAPSGTVDVTGERLRFHGGPNGALPPASFKATARLAAGMSTLDATLTAGSAVRIHVKGNLPLRADGPLDVRSDGKIDLALFNPVLAANGRTVQGQAMLTSRLTGTFSAPVVSGSADISGATFRDYVQGVRITDIKGVIKAEGNKLRVVTLTGKASPGTVAIRGTLTLAPGLPVDLALTFNNAAPLTTDILTANMNADLKVKGAALERLDVSGRVHINRAEINIPDSYPKSVAVLDVREPGQAAPKPRAPWLVGLDLTVEAPSQIFVRGHGLNAEMGGQIAISGTSEKPDVTGGFTLRRGEFTIASRTLTLTTGTVTFMGRSLAGRLDPALDFEARSTANNITATLKVTGYADAPQITLSSSPSLPQGELLSQLLFGQDTTRLSPFQAAEVAQALASLTGVSGGLDPLAVLRKGLGLDRLTVSGGQTSTSVPTVEAGKYITRNIYVGAKQNKLGGTQAEVQIDITKNLKLSTTVAAGGGTSATGATPENDPGSSIGLTYQFEY